MGDAIFHVTIQCLRPAVGIDGVKMKETVVESSAKAVVDLNGKIRVLHVDDDSGILKITKQCLELEAPVEVDTAVSVEEALKKLEKEKFDIVVSDYQMPGKDGLDFLKTLRSTGNTIPFIMFTGKGREEVAIKALNLGANQYLNKVGETETVYTELAHSITELARTRKAEEKQCESEEKFRDLFEKASDGLVFVDVCGMIVDVNQKAAEIAEKKKEDIVGRSFLDLGLVSSKNLDVLVEKLRRQATGKPIESFEFEIEKKNGEKRLIEIGSTFIQKNNMPAGSLAIVRDITERKKSEGALKESEAKYRALVDQSLQGIIVAQGPVPHILFANKAMAKILGYTPEELVSLSPQRTADLVHPEDREFFFGRFKERLEGKPTQSNYEVRGIRKDGTMVWLELSSTLLDYDGQPAVQATFMDVTERKRTEEALGKSEAELRAQFYGSPDLIMILDRKHRYVRINRTHFLSYEVGKLLGRDAIEPLPPDQRDLARTNVDRCFATGKIQEFEHTLSNGESVHARVVPMQSTGTVDQVMIISTNITERKKTEEALRESEERYSRLSAAAFEAIGISEQGKIVDANDQLAKMLGYEPSELIGKSVLDFVAPESRDLVMGNMRKGIEGPYEHLAIRKDGSVFPVEIRARLIHHRGHTARVSAIHDITQAKKLEKSLGENEEKFAGLFSGNPEATVFIDPNMNIVEINPRFANLFGYRQDEVKGKNLNAVIVPENLIEEGRMLDWKAVEGYVYHDTVRKRKDGSLVPVSVSAAPIYVQGRLIGYIGVYKDISEQKRAFAQFRGLFTGNPEAAAYLGPDFHILDVNPRFEELFGYSLAEIKGKHINEVVVPSDMLEEGKMLDQRAGKGYVYHDTIRKRKDGSLVPVSVSAAPIVVEGSLVGHVAMYKDIYELKTAEAAMKEMMQKMVLTNEKLQVVGGLTRHDVRNKLSMVSGNVYLLKKQLAGDSGILEKLNDMETAVRQVTEIFEFAKAYESLGVEELVYQDVGKTVDEAVALFPDLKDLKIINNCAGLTVLADSLLREMFYNLIDNSVKHGEKISRIEIRYEEASQDELRLYYEDDGVGVSEAVKPSLFKEGFTTGRGTGYGLYLIKKMMEVYGWTIRETGTPGKGAQFTITIPRTNQNAKENYRIAAHV
jgi:PAS domain S-box-containing protein